MTNSEFISLAEERGFRRVLFIKYEENVLILLLMSYPAGLSEADTREGIISGYYTVSNYAYQQARALSGLLKAEGYASQSNINVPLKPILIRSGYGEMGRNSLVAVDGLGSRFHIQTILTDCSFEAEPLKAAQPKLADRCIGCDRCVRACPTHAIQNGMRIDEHQCLRAVSEIVPPPVQFRPLLRNRLLGCDICQDVCPVNRGLEHAASPSIPLRPLFSGDINSLKVLIGVNYARKKRLRIKAAIAAANLRRTDLVPELTEMSRSTDADERETAEWALKIMLENHV